MSGEHRVYCSANHLLALPVGPRLQVVELRVEVTAAPPVSSFR